MSEIVELYMEGWSISEIAQEVDCTEEEVLQEVRSMKIKNQRDYTDDFKEMVIERILSGVKRKDIVNELGVAYRTINKYLEQYHVDTPENRDRQEELMYKEIAWESFTECPECHSKRVNDLNMYQDDENHCKNSYCLNCGTEWLERNEKVYKILWEYVR